MDTKYYVNSYPDLNILKENEIEIHYTYNGCYEGRFSNSTICNQLNFPKYCSGTIFISSSDIESK